MAFDRQVRVSFVRKSLLPLLLAIGLFGAWAGPASARPGLKTVSFRGASVLVPVSWPVFHDRAGVCVRFDRHAVYLGAPAPRQSCPVTAAGRTESILIAAAGSASGLSGADVTRRRVGAMAITATWRRAPGVIRRALAVRRLAAAPRPRARITRLASARAPRTVTAAEPATPGAVFTGPGFDACATPSSTTMAAWGASSPYGAIGVYIGGVNMACPQPNLTATWVSTESAAGWHLAPIYVGLQAPSNSCGCSSMSTAQASTQGAAAAADAVADAQAVGLGPGNPIYDDMEGYSRTSVNSTAVLAFLEAWTEELHTLGYVSGIYSSDASGVADLAAQLGSGYVEPDDIWIAAWNGQANTTDTTIPSTAWPTDQRIHQYQGGTNATYGGVRINVDNDYLDAVTAAYGSSAAPPPMTAVPTASAAPTIQGTPVIGQTLTELHADWSGSPTTYAYQWLRCPENSGSGCVAIPGATAPTYTLTSADRLRTLKVAETATNAGGTSGLSISVRTVPIYQAPVGYWSFTASGAIANSEYQLLWGSPPNDGLKDFAGMAATPDRRGYWMVTRTGAVSAFGDAVTHPKLHVTSPVKGIVRAGTLGYWLYTTHGNVYAASGTPFAGSAAASHLTNIVGMAALPSAKGYWLVTRRGYVLPFGTAHVASQIKPVSPTAGIVTAGQHGYWLFTTHGNVYSAAGAPYFGSPGKQGLTNVVAMLATPDAKGYWLMTATGAAYAYGDATRYPNPTLTGGAVVGLAG